MLGMVNTMNKRSVTQILGEWTVQMEWPEGVFNGGPSRLVIEPTEGYRPARGLSSTVLRDVDFRSAVDQFQKQIKGEKIPRSNMNEARAALASGVTDRYLALLSAAYVELVNRGQEHINDHLAELMGRPTPTIRGHLWQARKKGLLTGVPGRKGGELTSKARTILAKEA